ncbi:MAG: arylesterase [Marinoscillum sp.]|uniref:arylesterase n=1 Tax=Marinoscillum sp. TaxID=2024838 RepID=UPI0032F935AE
MSGCDSQNKSATNEGTTAVENQSSDTKQDQKEVPVILFFGNSITAGYQLDVEDAFPALIQDRLDSLGYEFKVINAGLSGETTSGGLNRIEWVLQTIPDVFVLELGANDGLRGLDLDETKKNLLLIIDKVKEANPEVKILLVGMRVPPNLGKDYTTRFSAIFPAVASETGASLLPFILDGVAGNPELNLPDGIHPTVEGHQILAENVWRALRPILEEFQTL